MKNNLIKKIVSSVAVTSLALGLLAGCGNSSQGNASPSPEAANNETLSDATEAGNADAGEDTAEYTGLLKEIKDRGYIIVGTEGTWSPYTFHDEDDNLVGYDVEVAKYIADYIGVDIQYSETVWSSMFASLDAGQIDVVINGVSYNEERAVKYDFSIPYNYSQYAFLALA